MALNTDGARGRHRWRPATWLSVRSRASVRGYYAGGLVRHSAEWRTQPLV